MGFEPTTLHVLDQLCSNLWATKDSLASKGHFCGLDLRTASRSHTVRHKQHIKA